VGVSANRNLPAMACPLGTPIDNTQGISMHTAASDVSNTVLQPNQGPQGNELVIQLHGPRGTYGAKHIPALNAAQLHRLAGANKCVLCAVGWGERMYQLIPRPHSCPATIQFHQRMVPREYAGPMVGSGNISFVTTYTETPE
jgi:hypothetical protein